MNIVELAREIIEGRRLSRSDDLTALIYGDLSDLTKGADMIRRHFCGNRVELCTIVNGKSGRCSENCRFCAQSAHHCTQIEEYGFLGTEELLAECRRSTERGVRHFAIVTAGRSLSGTDFESALTAFKRMKEECDVLPCASFGLLTDEQFRRLKESGVSRIHCNIETSRRNFPNICTTHTFEDKIGCIKSAQRAGFEVCSGGIMGMGETWDDRIDMAHYLAELGIRSIPLNILTPIKGTAFADLEPLDEEEILRIIAIFRYIVPEAYIRLAAGRNRMTHLGANGFRSGANAAITGDMLTTSGSSIRDDMTLMTEMGLEIV